VVGLIVQSVCTLTAIAILHSENRVVARLAMGLYSTAAAVCILLIVAHDRPFTGQNSIQPSALIQVQPNESAATTGP
jgi:hypothetical protein